MKEKIYTIPVMDALRDSCECSFCYMISRLEEKSVDFMMGASASYMEGDIRLKTNVVGFCPRHYESMYKANNTLGLALTIHTHLKQINKDLTGYAKNVKTETLKKGVFSKNTGQKSKLSEYIAKLQGSCYICDMMNDTYKRYVDTFFWLWINEAEVKKLITEGKGFCLSHFCFIIETSAQKLSQKQFEQFCDIVVPVQMDNFKRLEEEVDWFVKKFDSRFAEEPWKTSKDAIPRSILKLSSNTVKE